MRAFSLTLSIILCCGMLLAAPPATEIDSITLERTACYGPCPSYTITIHRDGTVAYHGRSSVKVGGRRTRKIPVEQFQKLAREVERIGFFSFKAEYTHKENPDGSREYVTDRPFALTTVRAGKLRKRVENYYGGPDSLARLENLIDKVTGSSTWTGVSN